jgi:hypothetical protein
VENRLNGLAGGRDAVHGHRQGFPGGKFFMDFMEILMGQTWENMAKHGKNHGKIWQNIWKQLGIEWKQRGFDSEIS